MVIQHLAKHSELFKKNVKFPWSRAFTDYVHKYALGQFFFFVNREKLEIEYLTLGDNVQMLKQIESICRFQHRRLPLIFC